ncbi:MAG: hypothetical protein M3367_03200 [Acidobacteriota bacterium]|nr:hypothetical protein [Acidobacteriota bacterium]
MDEITILIFLGFAFTGFMVGYPLGHIFGQRKLYRNQPLETFEHQQFGACLRTHSKRHRENYDVLNADILT